MKWNNIPREEQETIINFDYLKKTINLYTTRYAVGNKLIKRVGQPTKINYTDNKVDGVQYQISMNDSRVRKLLSITALIIRDTKKRKKMNKYTKTVFTNLTDDYR